MPPRMHTKKQRNQERLLLLFLFLFFFGLFLRLDEIAAGLAHRIGGVGRDHVRPLAGLGVEVLDGLFERRVLRGVGADGRERRRNLEVAVGTRCAADLRRVALAVLQRHRVDAARGETEFGLGLLRICDSVEVEIRERGIERVRLGGVEFLLLAETFERPG